MKKVASLLGFVFVFVLAFKVLAVVPVAPVPFVDQNIEKRIQTMLVPGTLKELSRRVGTSTQSNDYRTYQTIYVDATFTYKGKGGVCKNVEKATFWIDGTKNFWTLRDDSWKNVKIVPCP